MNKLTLLSLATSLFTWMAAFQGNVYADSGIHVVVDGQEVAFPDAQPEIINGRTMVPITPIASSLNATITRSNLNYFIIDKGNQSIKIVWNSNTAYVNGVPVSLDSPAYIKNDRTYVPIRFVGEAFGGTVGYSGNSDTVYVDTFDPSTGSLYPVIKVDNGDTFEVKMGGIWNSSIQTVRLIGIQAPEMKSAGNLGMPYSYQAWNYLNAKLQGQKVYLDFDVKQQDKFGHLLAYAYSQNGTFLNADLLEKGYARVDSMTPDTKHDPLFSSLLKQAQASHEGVWSLVQDPWNGKDSTTWGNDGSDYTQKSIPQQQVKVNNVKISALNVKDQYITIVNNNTNDIDLSNWTIVSNSNGQTYHFPNGFILKSGTSVTVTSGHAANNNSPGQLLWTTNYVWNESGDTATLCDGQGNTISTFHS
ncbi:lamin tail domain-containing protein [Fodinisporobacter ferrooxydans]|uniref:Lamin tail domain-containing protein n=1 Tax=Fodinisporobacter ferrooxydans TaxID=2901836 RepID=A0ABY4CPM2_9BACL|nr:lamin tail domain-containing protein [Alicyclobacillaceae bacterium MYW30-H2]